jgi:hypothetical protein
VSNRIIAAAISPRCLVGIRASNPHRLATLELVERFVIECPAPPFELFDPSQLVSAVHPSCSRSERHGLTAFAAQKDGPAKR